MELTELKNLSQSDRVRKIAIGVGVGILLLALAYFLAIRPALGERSKDQAQIARLQSELQTSRSLVARGETIEAEHRQTGEVLRRILREEMVPAQNPLGWATMILQDLARREGVEISGEDGTSLGQPRRGRDQPPFAIQNYQVRFALRGKFHQIGRFLAQLEKRAPYGQLQTISINAPRRRADRQDQGLTVDLNFKFPRFTEEGFPPENRP